MGIWTSKRTSDVKNTTITSEMCIKLHNPFSNKDMS